MPRTMDSDRLTTKHSISAIIEKISTGSSCRTLVYKACQELYEHITSSVDAEDYSVTVLDYSYGMIEGILGGEIEYMLEGHDVSIFRVIHRLVVATRGGGYRDR